MIARIAFAVVTLLVSTRAAPAQQPLTLAEALDRAQRSAFGNRLATAEARTGNAQELEALRGILPTVRLEAGYTKTNDPIGAFGTVLRQRRITPADFSPDRLNYPGAVENYVASVVVEAPILNVDAHLGRLAARRGGDAADAAAEWTRTSTKVDVIRAYYGTVLAAEKTLTLEAALKAAQAHIRQAEQLVKAGMATRSDALLASVKAGEIETQLLEARGEEAIAGEALSVVLGAGNERFTLPQTLPPSSAIQQLLGVTPIQNAADNRLDVRAARHASEAARKDVARATSLYMPRVNAIARYDWNSATDFYGGDKNWSVGVMATWTPFAGASEIAERQAAGGREGAGRAALDAARARAHLEMSKAEVDRNVAVNRLLIAERGVQQSAEAQRIVARKYEGGLASIVDLLDASASDTRSRLALSHARYEAIASVAEYLKAFGRDPADIAETLKHELIGAQR